MPLTCDNDDHPSSTRTSNAVQRCQSAPLSAQDSPRTPYSPCSAGRLGGRPINGGHDHAPGLRGQLFISMPTQTTAVIGASAGRPPSPRQGVSGRNVSPAITWRAVRGRRASNRVTSGVCRVSSRSAAKTASSAGAVSRAWWPSTGTYLSIVQRLTVERPGDRGDRVLRGRTAGRGRGGPVRVSSRAVSPAVRRGRAAARPSRVPSTMSSRMNLASAAKTWNISRPPG
jgi:hypothetical protein